jgi:hypothetical protein
VEDVPGIPAEERRQALLFPGNCLTYLERYGAEQLFTGVPQDLMVWWCVWYSEFAIQLSILQDCATVNLQKVVDERLPTCATEKWYKDLFPPAQRRYQRRFNTVQKKKDQIKAICSTSDWCKALDPGKFSPDYKPLY